MRSPTPEISARTATFPPLAVSTETGFRMKRGEFLALMAAAMATTAIAIDVMLPAFSAVREEFGLDNPAQPGLIVSVFMMALGIGQLIYGPLADRFGRKPVLTAGLLLYIGAGVAATLAPTFELLLAARVVWGLGAASPRIVSRAILRDRYRGDELSRAMSFVVAIFLVVPAIAPLIGQLVLSVGTWRWTFAVGPTFALIVLVWSSRLPETLPSEERVSIRPSVLARSIGTVFTTPSALAGLISLTALFAAFLPFLSALERMFDLIYGRQAEFAFWFGLAGAILAGVTLFTARLVRLMGTDRTMTMWLSVLLGSSVALVLVSLSTGGVPGFYLFYGLVLIVVSADGALVPLLTSQSLEDVGHIAGTATSTIGAVSLFGGSILATLIDRSIQDTVTPLGIGYLVATLVAISATVWVRRQRRTRATTPAGTDS